MLRSALLVAALLAASMAKSPQCEAALMSIKQMTELCEKQASWANVTADAAGQMAMRFCAAGQQVGLCAGPLIEMAVQQASQMCGAELSAEEKQKLLALTAQQKVMCAKSGDKFCISSTMGAAKKFADIFDSDASGAAQFDAAKLTAALDALCAASTCPAVAAQTAAQYGGFVDDDVAKALRVPQFACSKDGDKYCLVQMLELAQQAAATPDGAAPSADVLAKLCTPCILKSAAFFAGWGGDAKDMPHVHGFCSRDNSGNLCMVKMSDALDASGVKDCIGTGSTIDIAKCKGAIDKFKNKAGCCAAAVVKIMGDDAASEAAAWISQIVGEPCKASGAKATLKLKLANVDWDQLEAQLATLKKKIADDLAAQLGISADEVTAVWVEGWKKTRAASDPSLVVEVTPSGTVYGADFVSGAAADQLKAGTFQLSSLNAVVSDPTQSVAVTAGTSTDNSGAASALSVAAAALVSALVALAF